MNQEMYNELFKDVVICGRYPAEKLDEMKWFIKSLEDKITILEQENQQLKSVIKETREYIWSTKYEWGDLEEDNEDFDIDVYNLLSILDKGGNNDN